MVIQRASFDKKGNVSDNESIAKVSEAQLNDSIFMSKAEIEDASFLDKVNVLLSKSKLTIVTGKAKECRNGNYRTFIGDLNYQPFTTAIE
ncbi:MAG: hypothetical protein P4L35_16035 [Ignavibacteriaceae bacterium]|nr:hypothetical protein [Ignavibacteriaceae bacterium]